MKKDFNVRLALLILGLFVLTTTARAQQKLVPSGSEISFVSKQMGVPVQGKFGKFDAQIEFNPYKLETSKIAFTIDLMSVNIGAKETMNELKKPGWFDSTRVPDAGFQSSGIKALGNGRFEVTGKLKIKSIEQAITVPVTLMQSKSNAITLAEGIFTIKRLDFKIGDGEWNDVSLVGNDVSVKFKLAITGINPL